MIPNNIKHLLNGMLKLFDFNNFDTPITNKLISQIEPQIKINDIQVFENDKIKLIEDVKKTLNNFNSINRKDE